ncbi:MAG: DNA recombination protein RmuC, partial [Actinomycetota bacterium]|nr:DNA recombination protein RmuC [Actinomycetota bacterium]
QGKVSRLTEEMMGMNTAANKMVQAMHSPVSRGKWGENSLRNIIETAGMLPYSDFTEQTTGEVEGRVLRPDVVINLPNQGSPAVDAKAPEFAEAYEKMIATESIEEQQLLLADHIKSMRAHVKTLSLKEYWNQFDRSPEFVVMFVPLESMLSDALKADPSLVDDAMRSRVLIASPMNLLALLLAAHRGWQDFRVQEDAKKIGDLTKELYKRFSTLFDYVRKTGKGIQQSTTNYNNLIGALESRVLPTLRKLDDLNVVDGEIASIEPLETSIRELSVPEETPEIENFDS